MHFAKLLCFSFSVLSFSQSDLMSSIKRHALINEQTSGQIILNEMIDKDTSEEDLNCTAQPKKKKTVELIFVGSISSQKKAEISTLWNGHSYSGGSFFKNQLEAEDRITLSNWNDLTVDEFKNFAQKYAKTSYGYYSNGSNRGLIRAYANFFLEGASNFYNLKDQENDKKAIEWFALHARSARFSEEENLMLINNILSALVGNYNDDRLFTKESDSNHRGFTRQANGLVNGEENDGGVCNDIHAIGCDLYKSLYPDRDCLVMGYNSPGSGYHEVMAVGNGTNDYNILNYSRLSSVQGSRYLSAHPAVSAAKEFGEFIRVQDYTKGKLRDIYLAKNEYGQWVHSLNQSSLKGGNITEIIKTDDPNSFGTKLIKSINNQSKKTFNLGASKADLSDGAKVYAVYARYDKMKENLSGISISLLGSHKRQVESAHKDFDWVRDEQRLNRFHLNTNFNKSILHYKSSKVKVDGLSFVDVELMGGWGKRITEYIADSKSRVNGMAYDGTLGAGFNLSGSYESDKVKIEGEIQERWNLGSRDYNAMHGIKTDLKKTLQQLRFHHQSLEAKLKASTNLKNGKKVFVQGEYYGANVGQNYGVRAGIEISNPDKDIELIVVTGYSGQAKGYKTQENWLNEVGNKGANLGIEIKQKSSERKLEINGGINNGEYNFRGKASVPLFKKEKTGKKKIYLD